MSIIPKVVFHLLKLIFKIYDFLIKKFKKFVDILDDITDLEKYFQATKINARKKLDRSSVKRA